LAETLDLAPSGFGQQAREAVDRSRGYDLEAIIWNE